MFSSSKLYKEDIEYITRFELDWSTVEDANILITGATGLIGTVLVDALMYKIKVNNLKCKVSALTRDKTRAQDHFKDYRNNDSFEIIQGDVAEKIETDKKVDYIINLASNTHPMLYATEPIKTIKSIVGGTKNILDLAVLHKTKRVINASSVEIYGENRGDTERFTEDYCGYINCNTLRAGYPEGKRLSEALCQAYIAEKKIDAVSIRLGRVYGSPFLQSDTKATSQFIRNAVNNEDIILKSEGKQEYSYVYVTDAVTALLLLMVSGKNGEAYNIASDEVKSFRDTAKILADMNNRRVIFETQNTTEKKGSSVVQKALMDSEKIQSLGWHANYDLRSGLERTVHILKDLSDAKE